MSVKLTTATVLLVLMAALAGVAIPATSALAAGSPGGASAPSSSTATTLHVRRTALATWFGPGFYGRQTACGQTLTPGVVGVANRTLPCGTLVMVTYSTHTLTVPVLDRGPYSRIGADWDLTAGAAQALGITETVRIHARVVGRAPNSPELGAPPASPSALLAGGALAG
ncbi:MAG TPA: septal ring lytic transglycosylase RlpA family protein [Solirubrobacteraceae bacterium]|jgi:rare lipoprotein A (peptidoglycan hydrolase)